MVRLECIEVTNEYALYAYYPENDQANCGVVGLDRKTDTFLFFKEADGDPLKIYATQAALRIQSLYA